MPSWLTKRFIGALYFPMGGGICIYKGMGGDRKPFRAFTVQLERATKEGHSRLGLEEVPPPHPRPAPRHVEL